MKIAPAARRRATARPSSSGVKSANSGEPKLVDVATHLGLVLPVAGSWTWGGGFLAVAGFRDLAGATLVHSLAGWCALTGLVVLGRTGAGGPARGPAAGQALARVRELVRLAGQWIPTSQGRPVYAPWMYPGIGQSELLAHRTGPGKWSLRLFGRLPGAGRTAAVVTVDGSRAAYRLMLENPAAAEAVIASLARVRLGRRELVAVCQSAGGLPDEAASGFWARILAGAARPFTGLHLRV